jgi:hypothetical protein
MKKALYALSTILSIFVNVSCNKEVATVTSADKKDDKKQTENISIFGGNVWVAQPLPNTAITADQSNLAFTANNLVFVALATTNILWQFDPATVQWSIKKSPFFNFTADLTDTKCVFTNGNNLYFLTFSTKTLRVYNLVTAAWTTVSSFPGTSGSQAAAAYTLTKGYILGGSTENWEYDFVANNWTQKTPCPGFTRYWPTAYAIGDNIYFGTGRSTGFFFNPVTQRPYTAPITTSDWYVFNITSNSWTIRAPFGGGTREQAVGFVANGKIYMGNGNVTVDGSGSPYVPPQSDFWAYDPAANSWTQEAYLPGGAWPPLAESHFNCVGVGGYGYGVGGYIFYFERYTPPYSFSFPAFGVANTINMP